MAGEGRSHARDVMLLQGDNIRYTCRSTKTVVLTLSDSDLC